MQMEIFMKVNGKKISHMAQGNFLKQLMDLTKKVIGMEVKLIIIGKWMVLKLEEVLKLTFTKSTNQNNLPILRMLLVPPHI